MEWLFIIAAIIAVIMIINRNGKNKWKNSIMCYGLSLPYQDSDMASIIQNTMRDFRGQVLSLMSEYSVQNRNIKIEVLFCLSFIWHSCMYTLLKTKGIQSAGMNDIDLKNIITIISDDITISNNICNKCMEAYTYYQNIGVPLPNNVSHKDYYTSLRYLKFFITTQ